MNVQALILLAEMLSSHRGLKLTTVSTYAANDGKFFGHLKSGAGCTLKRAEALLTYFDANWPADLEWPRDIPRPSKKKEAA